MIQVYWPTKSRRITSSFGPRSLSGDGFHDGIDIGAVIPGDNDIIVAAEDGTVARSYHSNSYGNCVVINHGGFSTLYAHLYSKEVKAGQSVDRGEVIGFMGSTGHSTGVHLHFEVRESDYKGADYYKSCAGRYVNCIDPETALVEYPETWEEKIMSLTTHPKEWIDGIKAIRKMAKENDIGVLNVFEFLPELIEKL